MPKKNERVAVHWRDAVLYGARNSAPPSLSKNFTEGLLYDENKDGLIIQAPLTYKWDASLGEYLPRMINEEGEPRFLFIPKGMIEKVERR